MGYTVDGSARIRIADGMEAEAVAALKVWAEGVGHVGYGDDERIQKETTVAGIFAAMGLDVCDADKPGCFEASSCDSWSEHYDEAAGVIAPFVAEGVGHWHGEDDSHWRWRFADGELHEDGGRIVYAGDVQSVIDGSTRDDGHDTYQDLVERLLAAFG